MTEIRPVSWRSAGDDRVSTSALLRLEGIGKSFPGVRALDDVSIEVLPGEVHGIVGENGAGKSTLMAVASGAMAADEGEVAIAGNLLLRPDPELARRFGIAVVFQEPALLPDLTVAENIWIGVEQGERPSLAHVSNWAATVLERWSGPRSFSVSTRVDRLDTHERFIVAIARAFAQNPRVLVLDEPTEHLQPEEVDGLFVLVREHVAAGNSVVYISHRIHEVKEIADRITVLRGGATQGTFDADSLSEGQIVTSIVGRHLDTVFPPKRPAGDRPVVLRTTGFAGRHFSEVDIAVRAGQIIGLAGIEGNGQRDFLRALAGLGQARGTVHVASDEVRLGGETSGIVLVPSDRHVEGIVSGLSVRENVSARHLSRIAPRGWISARKEDRLAKAVIDEFRVRTPSPETDIATLSGGNQQKVVMGSALELNSPVVLIDEPTQGVDVGARADIYDSIRRAANAGSAVIVLSSDARELAGIADEVLVFSRGVIIETLRGDDVTEESITARALNAHTSRQRPDRRRGRFAVWLSGDAAPGMIVGALLLVVGAITAVAVPSFLSPFNTQGLLVITSILGFVAIGQVIVLLTGGIDLSVGPLMATVTTLSSYYLVSGVAPVWHLTGWAIIAAACVLVGLVNWVLVDVVKLSPIIATLATFMALQGVALVLRPTPGGSIGPDIVSSVQATIGFVPLTFVVVTVAAVAADIVLRRTRAGVSLRAVGSDAERARLNGVRPVAVRLGAYLLCSICAGIGGIVLATQIAVGDASSGTSFTLASVTAAVIGGASAFGGRGLFIGAVLGALLVQVISSATTFLGLPTAWQYIALGVLTLAAVCAYSLGRTRVTAQ